MTKREALEEKLVEMNPEALFADGFDDAILGVARQFNTHLVAYDRAACIKILMNEMSAEDAEEFFEFNVVGGYHGENTPIFIDLETGDENRQGGEARG